MSLLRGPKFSIDPNVHLHAPEFEPAATVRCELRRLRYLGQAQQLWVERASLGFTASRYRELNVFDRSNHHGRHVTGAARRYSATRTAPPSARPMISAASNPSSAKTSTVCSASPGDGPAITVGVSLKLNGMPTVV